MPHTATPDSTSASSKLRLVISNPLIRSILHRDCWLVTPVSKGPYGNVVANSPEALHRPISVSVDARPPSPWCCPSAIQFRLWAALHRSSWSWPRHPRAGALAPPVAKRAVRDRLPTQLVDPTCSRPRPAPCRRSAPPWNPVCTELALTQFSNCSKPGRPDCKIQGAGLTGSGQRPRRPKASTPNRR